MLIVRMTCCDRRYCGWCWLTRRISTTRSMSVTVSNIADLLHSSCKLRSNRALRIMEETQLPYHLYQIKGKESHDKGINQQSTAKTLIRHSIAIKKEKEKKFTSNLPWLFLGVYIVRLWSDWYLILAEFAGLPSFSKKFPFLFLNEKNTENDRWERSVGGCNYISVLARVSSLLGIVVMEKSDGDDLFNKGRKEWALLKIPNLRS